MRAAIRTPLHKAGHSMLITSKPQRHRNSIIACARNWFGGLFASCALLAITSAAHAGIIVDSTHVIDYAGVVATPSQVFQITATGEIEMAATYGPYVTNPDGTILVAPPVPPPGEWGVYYYMLDETGGTPAVEGGVVNTSSRWTNDIGRLVGSPFGGLIAGFSSTLTPTSLSDFANGFTFIGSSGSITAPVGAPYLFLSINDTDRSDNVGAYTATVTNAEPVPEPSPLVLTVLGLVAGCAGRRQWSKPNRSGCI